MRTVHLSLRTIPNRGPTWKYGGRATNQFPNNPLAIEKQPDLWRGKLLFPCKTVAGSSCYWSASEYTICTYICIPSQVNYPCPISGPNQHQNKTMDFSARFMLLALHQSDCVHRASHQDRLPRNFSCDWPSVCLIRRLTAKCHPSKRARAQICCIFRTICSSVLLIYRFCATPRGTN